MDSATIVSIVLAVISLLGTVAIAFVNLYASQKLTRETNTANAALAKSEQAAVAELNNLARKHEDSLQKKTQAGNESLQAEGKRLDAKYEKLREERSDSKQTNALVQKYGQPLMVAAYELQGRLYELCQYPISKAHLESAEGLQDLKQYTCFKFAQYLAWTHLLRTKAQFFSFVDNPKLRKIADLVLRVDEEFDRRRGYDGQNVGVWPGSRVLVSERMLVDAKDQHEIPPDTVVIGFDDFLRMWGDYFKEPMAYFCQWIDDLVIARKVREEHKDDAFRATQHNLVDLVQYLDHERGDQKMYPRIRKLAMYPIYCDCVKCVKDNDNSTSLEYRSDTRHNDKGLRPWYRYDNWSPRYDSGIQLDAMRGMTSKGGFDQALYVRDEGTRDWRMTHWTENDNGTWQDERHPKVRRRGMLRWVQEMDEEGQQLLDEMDE